MKIENMTVQEKLDYIINKLNEIEKYLLYPDGYETIGKLENGKVVMLVSDLENIK